MIVSSAEVCTQHFLGAGDHDELGNHSFLLRSIFQAVKPFLLFVHLLYLFRYFLPSFSATRFARYILLLLTEVIYGHCVEELMVMVGGRFSSYIDPVELLPGSRLHVADAEVVDVYVLMNTTCFFLRESAYSLCLCEVCGGKAWP